MIRTQVWVCAILLVCCAIPTIAQQPTSAANAVVPTLVNFGGVVVDGNGKPLTGIVGITFYLYQEQQGGTPLWMETQNVQPDKTGRYSVMLGSSRSQGLPADIFTSGEARWLGVQPQGQAEQPRVMLLTVPYAMKAVDAETIGGLPPSAFVRTTPDAATSGNASGTPTSNAGMTGTSAGRQNLSGKTVSPAIETQNYVAKFTNGTGGLGNSLIYDNGTNVGVATSAPGFPLDVAGIVNAQKDIQGLGDLRVDFKGLNKGTYSPGIRFGSGNSGEGLSSARGGTTNVYGIDFYTDYLPRVSVTNGGKVGIGTRTPGDALDVVGGAHLDFSEQNTGSFTPNLVFGNGGSGEGISSTRSSGTTNKWGLDFWTDHIRRMSISHAGNVGIGTATPAAMLEVNGTAKFDGLVTFAAGQTVTGNLTATGVVTGSSFQIGSNLFAFGSYTNANAFLGFAGNATTTGTSNTASGYLALYSNTTGGYNTASGSFALGLNTTGSSNTANGSGTLASNTTGYNNTASGFDALESNTTGYYNTAAGYYALLSNTTGGYNTASGSFALYVNTTGSGNTASGAQALGFNTTGGYNTAIGDAALSGNSTGTANTASGYGALGFNTTGGYNTASGEEALWSNTIGSNNTASGGNALASNTAGSQNSASGSYALAGNTTGGYNTAGGYNALFYNTIGSYNTALGYGAGPDSTTPALTNSTAIGAYADVTASNALVLGSTAAQNGVANVSVGIDVGSPTNILTVLQGGGHAIADGWDTYSSRRWKTNIHTLNGALGKVEQLRGVSYDLKDSGKHEIGVIAEEVGAVVPEVVSYEKNGQDARGVDYSRLTALLIEATKEQQALIREQKEQLRAQQAQIKVQQKQIKAQQTQMQAERTRSEARFARLTSKITAIQATLKANEQSGSAIRTVKAEATTVRQ